MIFLRQVSMVKIESLYSVAKPTKYSRHIWPYQPEGMIRLRGTLNAAKKHVASRTLKSLQWNNSSVLGGDIVSAITALKVQPGHDLQIIGSGNLISNTTAISASFDVIQRMGVPGSSWPWKAIV